MSILSTPRIFDKLNTDNNMTTLEPMTRLRERRGLSKTELSKIVGCHYSLISHIERNKRRPSPELCKRIAIALRVPAKELAKQLRVEL